MVIVIRLWPYDVWIPVEQTVDGEHRFRVQIPERRQVFADKYSALSESRVVRVGDILRKFCALVDIVGVQLLACFSIVSLLERDGSLVGLAVNQSIAS